MAIELTTFLKPRGTNTFFLLEDKYIKGGLQSVPTSTDRDAISTVNRKAGMVVVTQSDKKLWILEADKLTWSEVQVGGGGGLKVRQTVVHTTVSIPAEAVDEFTLPLGKSCLIYELSVDSGPCMVQAYATSAKNETNPFTFKASASHLSDDGTTFMSDGTAVLGRRYSILMNLDATPSNNIYFTVTNKQTADTTFIVTISFLPLE